MSDFYQNVLDVLRQDDRFFADDGSFLRNAVYEAAMKMDPDLLHLLLSNTETKKRFFTAVDGIQVFDKVGFGWVINNRQFLPDSYTRFKNKIGLADMGGNLISQSGNVELVFPYKDCVLEGGQTREDQKRLEVFYNENLAPDEVDRLLQPKVFSKVIKYVGSGQKNLLGQIDAKSIKVEKNSANSFSNNDNLVIKGNNLLALASLLARYEGKISLIYIDPPYNTGSDEFKYNDSFNHSSWLTFMKNRLEIARRLLSPNGSIYVQIDANESAYLKVLMDEVFGDTFQSEIIWVLKGASGYKSLTQNYVRGHDSILFYSKSSNFTYNKQYLPYSDAQLKRFSSVDENGRKYKTITKDRRLYLDEAKGIPLTDVWDDIASFQTVVNSDEITGFSTQKPEKLIQRIIECSSNPGDIVLDFHAGSGTTAATALKMGRVFITVEQMDYVDDVVSRLIDDISGKQTGIAKAVNYVGGGSFVYCELATLNQSLADQIQSTSDDETLKDIFNRMVRSGFISCKVNPAEIDLNCNEWTDLSFENKQRFLMELLDKNLLYVNYCDIDDEEFNISEQDKAFTRSFYREV